MLSTIVKATKLMSPIQNLDLFRDSLNIISDASFNGNRQILGKIYLLYAFLLYYIGYMCYLWRGNLTDRDRVWHPDWVQKIHGISDIYPCAIAMNAMTIAFVYITFSAKPPFIVLARGVLFEPNHRSMHGVIYGNFARTANVLRRWQKFVWLDLNACTIFLVITGKFSIFSQKIGIGERRFVVFCCRFIINLQ